LLYIAVDFSSVYPAGIHLRHIIISYQVSNW
jgi:hypothetical protein